MPNHPLPSKEVCLNDIRFDSTIPPGAKILFAEFSQWFKERGSFPFNSKRLAAMYDVSPFTIRKWVTILAQHQLIDLYIDYSKGSQKKYIKVLDR
jgi:hypothetical protein